MTDREYIRQTAERYVANEDLFDRLGAPWTPVARETARLASDYLDLLAKVPALVEALKTLLVWSEYADLQIDGEWGVGDYVEDEALTAARNALAAWESACPPIVSR